MWRSAERHIPPCTVHSRASRVICRAERHDDPTFRNAAACRKRRFLPAILLCAILAGGCSRDDAGSAIESGREALRVQLGGKGAAPEAVGKQIQVAIETVGRPPYVAHDDPGDLLWNVTRNFYRRRNYGPAWVSDERGHRPGPPPAANRGNHERRAAGSCRSGRAFAAGAARPRIRRPPGVASEREAADLDLHLTYTVPVLPRASDSRRHGPLALVFDGRHGRVRQPAGAGPARRRRGGGTAAGRAPRGARHGGRADCQPPSVARGGGAIRAPRRRRRLAGVAGGDAPAPQ